MDLGTTARDGSEQADSILRAINNEPEEGLGQIEGFDWDDAMLKEEIDSFYKRTMPFLLMMIMRLGLPSMLKGEDLSIAELRDMYPPPVLEEEGYFSWVERDFEWYFDPKYFEFANLEDYQRLALRNTYEYIDWEFYHKTCSTLQSDREYVYFWETLTSKTKVYLCSIRFDNTWYGDYASLYFDIWKLVAKQKVPEGQAYKMVMEAVKKFVSASFSFGDVSIPQHCPPPMRDIGLDGGWMGSGDQRASRQLDAWRLEPWSLPPWMAGWGAAAGGQQLHGEARTGGRSGARTPMRRAAAGRPSGAQAARTGSGRETEWAMRC
ncbi:uncharacterized protein C2845_PM01G22540 [Panicum miliaceum]|uniref:Uncharacterized protein n=1 Tax=Panicum miliaceum TaxID=4540 RepID=A0A3L6TLI1_PANMI|nr:uncharacterized protein C2845_PM01G22540 [Panicum miliaceum]